MDKQRIIAPKYNGLSEADRIALASLLIKAGFTVRIGSEKANSKVIYFVEYWYEAK